MKITIEVLPFTKGQRVQMTEEARAMFRGPYTGVVVGYTRRPDRTVRVVKDGQKTPQVYAVQFWEAA
jgi:hypothetical protein